MCKSFDSRVEPFPSRVRRKLMCNRSVTQGALSKHRLSHRTLQTLISGSFWKATVFHSSFFTPSTSLVSTKEKKIQVCPKPDRENYVLNPFLVDWVYPPDSPPLSLPWSCKHLCANKYIKQPPLLRLVLSGRQLQVNSQIDPDTNAIHRYWYRYFSRCYWWIFSCRRDQHLPAKKLW